MNVVILGAGNGGLSLAGDLVLKGIHVAALYDRFPATLADVRTRGGVELVGPVRAGFAPLPLITDDIATAIGAGDVLLVSVPAFAHEWLADAMAPYVKPGSLVVLGPGYIGGTILFRNALRAHGTDAGVTFVSLSSLAYATRIVGPAQVGIKAVKRKLLAAAMPYAETPAALAKLAPLFPELVPSDSVLTVEMINQNPISHVPTYLLNLGRVDDAPTTANFDWHDWVTPDIKLVQTALDAEIQAIGKAGGLQTFTQAEMSDLHYRGIKWQIIQPTGKLPESAVTMPTRFITEDVPMGLVPLAQLGDVFGVETPVIDGLIALAAIVKRTDYWKEGRTLERLGLAGLGKSELLRAFQ
jgi:opine dehydrogenase